MANAEADNSEIGFGLKRDFNFRYSLTPIFPRSAWDLGFSISKDKERDMCWVGHIFGALVAKKNAELEDVRALLEKPAHEERATPDSEDEEDNTLPRDEPREDDAEPRQKRHKARAKDSEEDGMDESASCAGLL